MPGTGRMRVIARSVTVLAILAIALASSLQPAGAQTTQVQMSSYQTALIPMEGGAKGFQAQSASGTYLGAFQLGPSALQTAGFQNANGTWTAQAQSMGVNSTSDFLNNPAAQVAADNAYNSANLGYLSSKLGSSTYNSMLNQPDPYNSNITLTPAAMTYCSESLGAGGCASYLQSGNIPASALANNPSWQNGGWQNNLATISNTSTTSTGTTTVSTISSSSTSNGVTTNATTTTVSGIYCDPAIQAQITDAGRAMVDNWTTLASSPGSGYSLLGGQSVLEAAGLLGSGQPGYVGSSGLFGSQGGTFGQASCLNNLIGSGINIIFQPPNLSGILSALEQAACHEVQSLISQATQPLSQSVYQAFSLNGLVPGLNLGSLGGSAGISVGQSASGSLVSINGSSPASIYTPDNGWYQSSGTSTSSYGSLFSTSPSGGSGSSFLGGLF